MGPDCLVHAVAAGVAFGREHDQRLLGQAQQRPQEASRLALLGADRCRLFDSPAAGEHRQPPEQALLLLRQEVVAPVDGGHQGLMVRDSAAAGAGQQLKAVSHSFGEIGDCCRPQARRREL